MSVWLAWYLATGLLAGLLAGLMGVGGGLVIVPALLFAFAWQGVDPAHLAHLAVGTSLAAIVPIAIASLRAHHRHGAVEWPAVARLAPGLMLGAWGGAWLAKELDTQMLQRLFGAFLVLVAWQMVRSRRIQAGRIRLGGIGLGVAGLGIGLVSGLVGIGGGTMTVPLLAWQGRPLPRAVGTSAACGLPIALAGALGFFYYGRRAALPEALGFIHWPALLPIAVLAVLAAPWGARLAHRLPVRQLRRLFALVLLAVAARLWLT